MADIIADSQTARTIDILLKSGSPSDVALASVLISQTKLVDTVTSLQAEVKEIKGSLWDLDHLNRLVDERHDRACAECPTKRIVEQLQKERQDAGSRPKQHWVIALANNSAFQFFIIVVLLIGAFIYLTTGRDGVEAAKDAMTHVATGGLK